VAKIFFVVNKELFDFAIGSNQKTKRRIDVIAPLDLDQSYEVGPSASLRMIHFEK